MKNNIIIKNAIVIDPVSKSSMQKDLFIKNGLIAENFEEKDAQIIDANGCYLTSGFIDIHAHLFERRTTLGINADIVGVRQGVTKVVDAGSVGLDHYDLFKREVIDGNITDVYFFLNISRYGLVEGLSELADTNHLINEEQLANFTNIKNSGMVGLKVRMSASVVKDSGIKPLIHARKLADKFHLPIMVHIGTPPPSLGDVLDLLKAGDIVTHIFHGKMGGVCDYLKQFSNAVKRGVHFDVGHGSASFSLKTAHKILEINKIDYSISTDIYLANYDTPVKSLATTMSKFYAVGLTTEEIVHKVTGFPSSILGIEYGLGIGKKADLTMFKVINSKLDLVDSEGFTFSINKVIKPTMTFKEGRIVWKDGEQSGN